MTNNEPQFPRDERHFCQKCGQHLLALHTRAQCPTERPTDNYKPADQGKRDHRPLNDFWLAMKESDKR